jgi:two-component system NarL family sensor kinase
MNVSQGAVTTSAGLTVLCGAVTLSHPLTFWSVAMPVLALVYLSVPLVGSAMVRADPRNASGWVLVISGIALPVACTAYVLAEAADNSGRAIGWPGWWDGWPWVFALGLTPTLGLLLFPDGRLPSRRWRPVLALAVLQSAALLFGLLFSPGLLDFPAGRNPIAFSGSLGSLADGLVGTIVLIAPLSTVAAWSIQRRRRQTKDPLQSAALRLVAPGAWLIAASWWTCIVITALGGTDVSALPVQLFAVLVLALTAWLAIRRYGLFDGRRVLNRALLYGLLSLLVVVVYLVAAALVSRVTTGTTGAAVGVVAAVLVALPLRDFLRRVANRLVYGASDGPDGALVQLGRRLEVATAASEVLPAVTATIRAALRLRYAEIRLARTTARSGNPSGGQCEQFPLVFAGESIGTVIIEAAGGELTASERRLLTDLLGQIAAAAHAVALTADLSQSRERLVGVAEEERRRLRRDLHDGLGPALAGVVLGLQRARRRLESDPADTTTQLDVLTDQTQAAVAEVRRLVYGLRPPALDELGLVGALVEQASSLGAISVRGAVSAELPAAVEVAAYRIAVEAMTNAIRHARAAGIVVCVGLSDAPPVLRLEIVDDGRGLPAGYRAGVGITSMRERAAELGGSCRLANREPGGTRVLALLPLGEP